MFDFGQSQNLMKSVFDHHKQTTKHTNSFGNRTKPIDHYTALRRKITRVGGNLPIRAQFRVLCRSGLLTAQHSFLFLFLFPLFIPFLFLFSSFLFFSFPPFLLSFLPLSLFLSSLYLFPSSSYFLLFPRTESCSHSYSFQECHAYHVSHIWLSMCPTCLGFCHAL